MDITFPRCNSFVSVLAHWSTKTWPHPGKYEFAFRELQVWKTLFLSIKPRPGWKDHFSHYLLMFWPSVIKKKIINSSWFPVGICFLAFGQSSIGPLQLAITWLDSTMLESKRRWINKESERGEVWLSRFTFLGFFVYQPTLRGLLSSMALSKHGAAKGLFRLA